MTTNPYEAELKNNIYILKDILNRLIDKSTFLPDNIAVIAYQFIFENLNVQELNIHPPIFESLVYLKNIVTRNQFQTVKDLQYYYEKKHAELREIARRMQPGVEVDTLSINFEGKTYILEMKTPAEQAIKISPIFYSHAQQNVIAVEFDNISYSNTIEEEKKFLAEVKGNHLKKQQNESNILKSTINKVISN